MKATICLILWVLMFAGLAHGVPVGTAFTYQGELKHLGAPANGAFDFEFQMYNGDSGGIAVAGPLLLDNVAVVDGVFTVELDFGPGTFGADQLWLAIGVREGTSTGGYAGLLPRQKITAVPHALHALDDADTDATNEIQDLSLNADTLSLTGDATSVDLSLYLDDTDDQTLSEVLAQGNDAGGQSLLNIQHLTTNGTTTTNALTLSGLNCSGNANGGALTANASGVVFCSDDNDSPNTLDGAYDQGGSGAGGTISADSGAVVIEGAGGLTLDSGDLLQLPGNPVLAGSLAIGIGPSSVALSGRYAYVVDTGSDDLKVIDVSDPSAPSLVGSLGIGTGPNSVYVSGRYAYVVDNGSDDLKVIDVSDPSAPSLAGSRSLVGTPLSVYVSGRYAYVVDASSDDLFVIDVSNPSAPGLAGSLYIGGGFPRSVVVSGRYAYVVDSDLDDLKVINVSNPSVPFLAGSLGLGTNPISVYVSGRYAYVVDSGSDDLKVIDVSDPSALSLVGSLAIGASPVFVVVSGRYAYVVDALSDDLKVIDISGAEVTSLIAHSLEAGNLQVRNDIVAQGQLQVTGGVNIGSGGLFSDGNVGISGTIAIANDIAPLFSLANAVRLFAQDVAASSELMVRDEAGNITTLSPHNFSLIGEPSEPMAWSFYSENDHGKINVDMLRAMRLVERMSGEKLVHAEPKGNVGFTQKAAIDGQSTSLERKSASVPMLLAYIEALQAQNRALERRLEALERNLN